MTSILLILSIALLALGRVGTLSAFNVGIKAGDLSVSDVLVAALILSYSVHCLLRDRVPFFACRRWRTLSLFFVWALFSLLFNVVRFQLTERQAFFSAAYLLRWGGYSFIYAAACEFAAHRRSAERLIRVMTGAAVAFALFGVIQAIYLPNFAFILNPQAIPGVDFDMQGHRLVSTFLDPNLACAFLSATALVALSLYLQGLRRWLVPALVLGLGALFTLSRGGILGLAAGGSILFLGSGYARKRLGVTLILAGAVLLGSLPWWLPIALKRDRFSVTDQSALSRLQDWKFAGSVVQRHPLVGVGFNTFGFVAPRFGLEVNGNSSFGLAGDLFLIPVLCGLPGLAIYLTLIGGNLRSGALARLIRSPDAWERGIAGGVRSATLACVVASLFTSVLLYPPTAAVLWLLWAVLEQTEAAYLLRSARTGVAAKGPGWALPDPAPAHY